MKLKERISSFKEKRRKKKLARIEKRTKKILSKILGITMLFGVLLSCVIIPSSADFSIGEQTYPILPKGVYDVEFNDDDTIKFNANIMSILQYEEVSIPKNIITITFTDSNQNREFSLIPVNCAFKFEGIGDVVVNYGYHLQFFDEYGNYVEFYSLDSINMNNPQSILDSKWYGWYSNSSSASSLELPIDSLSFTVSQDLYNIYLCDYFLCFTSYDYILDTVVEINQINTMSNIYLNEVYNVDLHYMGGVYTGPWHIEFPYYTGSGALRIFAYRKDELGNYLDRNFLEVNANKPLGFGIHFQSIKSIPKLYAFLRDMGASFGVEPSYSISGKLYAKRYIKFPDYFYSSVQFESNGQKFGYISSGILEYGDGSYEKWLRYDNVQVYQEEVNKDGIVEFQGWTDIRYKIVDFGSDPQNILPDLYYFLLENFSLADSAEALEDAWDDGYQTGYDMGYETGYGFGHNDGYELGHSRGYNEGYDSGYQVGYNYGYADGASIGSVQGDTFVGGFFGSIVDALDSLTIFDGFSVYDIIITILGGFILMFILKLIAGG